MTNKYYIIESGPVLEAAQRFRKEYGDAINAINNYVGSIGGKGFQIGLGGKLTSVVFEGERPKGFKKPDRMGGCQPYVRSDYQKQFYELPKVPQALDYVQNILNIPLSVSYEYKGHSVFRNSGFSRSPVQICWYKKDGPLLLIITDVLGTVEDILKHYPGATFPHDEDKWLLDETGLKEILREEWDLMVAKHKLEKQNNDE